MKKHNKKFTNVSIIRKVFGTPRRTVFLLAGLVAGGYLGYLMLGYGWAFVYNYRTMSDQASMEPIRTLIIRSLDEVGTPAGIEPKTGDAYFSEAKLYLPATALTELPSKQLRYYWYPEDKQLQVILPWSIRQKESLLYIATNMEAMFKQVGRAQACAHGVLVSFDSDTHGMLDDQELVRTTQLANGKTVHAYIEKSCPENSGLASRMDQLTPY